MYIVHCVLQSRYGLSNVNEKPGACNADTTTICTYARTPKSYLPRVCNSGSFITVNPDLDGGQSKYIASIKRS